MIRAAIGRFILSCLREAGEAHVYLPEVKRHLAARADPEASPLVSDIVELFGGTSETARLFGVGPSAVSNWKTWNRFPPHVHFRVFKECERRGVLLPDSFFMESASGEGAAA